jgi:hypothetical protein
MNEFPAWISPLVALIGSLGGAYIGVRIGLTRVETQMAFALEEIKKLWEWIRDHDETDRQWYARVAVIESRLNIRTRSGD